MLPELGRAGEDIEEGGPLPRSCRGLLPASVHTRERLRFQSNLAYLIMKLLLRAISVRSARTSGCVSGEEMRDIGAQTATFNTSTSTSTHTYMNVHNLVPTQTHTHRHERGIVGHDLLFAEPEIVLAPFEQLRHSHFMHFLAGRSYTTTASHPRMVGIQYLNAIVQCSLVLFACTTCDTSTLNPCAREATLVLWPAPLIPLHNLVCNTHTI
jgi:hypothetical protein